MENIKDKAMLKVTEKLMGKLSRRETKRATAVAIAPI
jgi:hypothetical protein